MSLTITLYKNCILTAEYKEGFNMRIPASIDSYLANLTKLQIYSGDDIYFTNSGTISVDNVGLTTYTASGYNYMVFSSTYNSIEYKRYCFVKNITLVNEVAVIEYEEDLWSNYSGSLRLRFGNLVQAKKYNSGTVPLTYPPRYLPKDYESNLPIKMTSFTTATNTNCYVVADVAVYKLVSGGGTSFRFSCCCIIGNTLQRLDGNDQPVGSPVDSYKWRIDNDMLRILAGIKIQESSLKVHPNIGTETIPSSDNDWRFELLSVKLIPGNIGDSLFSAYTTGTGMQKLFNDFGVGFSGRYFSIAQDKAAITPVFYILSYIGGSKYLNYLGTEGNLNLTVAKTKTAGYKVKGLINYSRFISIPPNGQDLQFTYIFTVNAFASALLLNVNNEIVDISSDFTLPLPFSVQSADITQQQAISRSLTDMNNAMGQISTLWKGGMQAGKDISMLNSVGFLDTWISTGANLTMGAINRESQNMAKYSTSRGVSITQRAVENCILDYGFSMAEIDPQNEDEVNTYLTKFGYKFDNTYVIDSNVFDSVATDQFVQFSQVAIYGEFSNDIASQLKQILLNGIYIFGSATV